MAEPEIRSKEALEAWLEGKPREISVVLASRVAMRVFPLIGQMSSFVDFEPDVLLPLCRVMALPWAAGKYPAHGRDLDFADAAVAAAAVAVAAVATAVVAAADNAYADAAAAVAAAVAAADDDAYAAYAADAAAYAAAAAYADAADIWASLEADCRWLVGVAGSEDALSADHAKALSGRPLWPNHMPEWMKQEWQSLKEFMERAGNDWPVWIRWYEARLSGLPSLNAPGDIVEKLDLMIARIDEEDWKKGPAHANAMIAGFYQEAEQEARPRGDFGGRDIQVNASPELVAENFETVSAITLGLLQVVQEERKTHRHNRPNEPEQLEEWQQKDSFFAIIETKCGEICDALAAVDAPEDTPEVAAKVASLFDGYRDEVIKWLREHKEEMVNWAIRLPVMTLSIGLLNLVGTPAWASFATAAALAGGGKVFDILKRLKDKTSKEE